MLVSETIVRAYGQQVMRCGELWLWGWVAFGKEYWDTHAVSRASELTFSDKVASKTYFQRA